MRIRSSHKTSLAFILVLFFLYCLNYVIVFQRETQLVRSDDLPRVCPVIEHASNSCVNVENVRIPCSIDNSLSLHCLKDKNDVFIPFSYIKKQFDVTGREKDGKFEWQTSYAKMRLPDSNYNSSGQFGHFATYNVETRERVKCINPLTGVPMSTQWDPTPYYYPIQIAQYGLQHYSRMITQVEKTTIHNVGENSKEWKGAPGFAETTERIFFTGYDGSALVNISTDGNVANPGAYVGLSTDSLLTVISLSFLPHDNASFSILLSLTSTNQLILLHYIPQYDSSCVWSVDNEAEQLSFMYSLPYKEGEWISITRDILVDASRALSSTLKGNKKANSILRTGDISLHSVSFRGSLTIRQKIEQRNEMHKESFLAASNWFLLNQDQSGGWKVPVERRVAEGKVVLSPGWVSSMGQGHALSLLSRAFLFTQDNRYLRSAEKALSLFTQNVTSGGVRNYFFSVPWYEEYPTTPGSFVLNGFLYSLIGLYDLSSVPPSSDSSSLSQSRSLFLEGLSSLRIILPLYDTGSGSTYDLRHFGLKTPPNLARWDYHAVHVYLLKWIVSITDDSYLDEVANRWIGYANGKRAKHN